MNQQQIEEIFCRLSMDFSVQIHYEQTFQSPWTLHVFDAFFFHNNASRLHKFLMISFTHFQKNSIF